MRPTIRLVFQVEKPKLRVRVGDIIEDIGPYLSYHELVRYLHDTTGEWIGNRHGYGEDGLAIVRLLNTLLYLGFEA